MRHSSHSPAGSDIKRLTAPAAYNAAYRAAFALVAAWALASALWPAGAARAAAQQTAAAGADWQMQTARAVRSALPRKGARAGAAAPKMSNATLHSAVEAKAATSRPAAAAPGGARATQAGGANTQYYILNVEFNNPAARRAFFPDDKTSRVPGAFVLTQTDRFADLFVTGDAPYTALKSREGGQVVRVEVVGAVEVPPPPPVAPGPPGAKAVPESVIRGGYQGMTGKGVVLAVADTGLDFRHPDFITYDAAGQPTSRLLYLWDTSVPYQPGRGRSAPFAFPNRTSIGTLYTREQLTAALRAEARGRPSNIPATDLDGHGTACASVAAGNGNGMPANKTPDRFNRADVIGVAPEADLVGIRLGEYGLENSYLLNAASEWLDREAGARPLVLSCSFGGHGGGHDGQSVSERHLNARWPLERAGRAIVIAAGNEGRKPIHAEVVFGNKENAKLIRWNSLAGAFLNLYFDSGEEGINIAPAGATKYEFKGWDLNPITGQWSATLKLGEGQGGLWLFNDSGRRMKANVFSPSSAENGGPAAVFAPDVVAYSTLVGDPGTTPNAVTVGSYDWNDNFHMGGSASVLMGVCRNSDGELELLTIGDISCYSSPGPTRLGAWKPEVVAPGEWYTSSYAKVPGGGGVEGWRVDSTGNYVSMNGTSAATPYTAGFIALMFQKKPALTLGEVRTLLTTKSTRDNPFTGAVPNKRWGYGKLDMAAAKRIFDAL